MTRPTPWLVPLAAMLGTQIAAAIVLAAVPVLAPEMARVLGVEASLVGVYSSVVFAAATLVSAASGAMIARLGPVRTNQLGLVCAGAGLLAATVPAVPGIALAAVLVGAGYGPNTPSGSQVLARVVPARRRALAFSLKQSGAPLGGMLAGAALPFVVAVAGWQAALGAGCVLALVLALAVEPLRRRLDDARPESHAEHRPGIRESMRIVLADRAARRLVLGGFLLMIVHGCFQTFYVAYLVEGVGLSLAAAGGLYAVLQGGAAISRVVLGWLADRAGDARRVLAAIAVLALVASLVTTLFEPGWPSTALAAVSVLAGVGSSGWYGVFLAEVARAGTAERAGLATGVALFFVYGAIVGGPLVISSVVWLAGSYAPAFTLVAVLSGLAGAAFLAATTPR